MIGIPPHTAASKPNWTGGCPEPSRFAFTSVRSAFSSGRSCAISALFAVTTCFPPLIARVTTSFASVTPPITSTTMSMSASSSTSLTSVTIAQPAGSAKSRALLASRTQSFAICTVIPRLSLRNASREAKISAIPPPTVPPPTMPTRTADATTGPWRLGRTSGGARAPRGSTTANAASATGSSIA